MDLLDRLNVDFAPEEHNEFIQDIETNFERLNVDSTSIGNTIFNTALLTSHLANENYDFDTSFDRKVWKPKLRRDVEDRGLQTPDQHEVRFYDSGDQMVRDATYHGFRNLYDVENQEEKPNDQIISNVRASVDSILEDRDNLEKQTDKLFLYGKGDLGYMIFANREKAEEITAENSGVLTKWAAHCSAVINSQMNSSESNGNNRSGNEKALPYPISHFARSEDLTDSLSKGHARAMVGDMYASDSEVGERYSKPTKETLIAEECIEELEGIRGWRFANRALNNPPNDLEEMLDPEGYSERLSGGY